MRIGIISDTHMRDGQAGLRSDMADFLRSCDMIIHAGDFVSMEALIYFHELNNVVAVSGNMDKSDLAKTLPRTKIISVLDRNIGILHGHQAKQIRNFDISRAESYSSPYMEPFYKYLEREFPECGVVVFGHFHMPVVLRRAERLLINPGSAMPYQVRPSCALLTITKTAAEAEIHYF
jgi:putative phosphoesterase